MPNKEISHYRLAVNRVEAIIAAVAHYQETGVPQSILRDILTDLRHYAAANVLEWDDALDGSYEVYLEES